MNSRGHVFAHSSSASIAFDLSIGEPRLPDLMTHPIHILITYETGDRVFRNDECNL